MLGTSASMPPLLNLNSLPDFPEALDTLVESLNLLKMGNDVKAMDRIKQMEDIISHMKRQWPLTRSLPNGFTTAESFDDPHQHQPDPESAMSDSLAARYGGKICDLMKMISLNPTTSSNEKMPELDKLERDSERALLCFCLFGIGNKVDSSGAAEKLQLLDGRETESEEDKGIKKRELIQWWVGQELIQDGEEPEAAAERILKELLDVKVIEPIDRYGKKRSDRYQLAPRILCQIEKKIREIEKVGLLRKGESSVVIDPKDDHIEVLFNPGETILNLKQDCLANKKHLKIIHLGRWCCDPEQHLQVEGTEFLKYSKKLKNVRLLSLKGVSRIMELPDSIGELSSLRVLDLRACPNLEVLPKEIGKLKNLTHLDLSECYLLDHIPKAVISLIRLKVLDGFVISDVKSAPSCSLKDLSSHLGKSLKKLSISARKSSFPEEEDLEAFAEFDKLEKLKIIFVTMNSNIPESSSSHIPEASKKQQSKRGPKSLLRKNAFVCRKGLPPQLVKLELQAMPKIAAAKLLGGVDCLFETLKKLYIIGGDVSHLGQGKQTWEEVEAIHLKYLTKLHMDWRQFKGLFPKVAYLEMVQCPNLSFFPCDRNGIWEKCS